MANIKAKIKIVRGLKSTLPVLSEGELGYATDTNELFIGDPTDGNVLINAGSYNDASIKQQITDVETALAENRASIEKKVDKVSGKGLSTVDFTTELSNKLTQLQDLSTNFKIGTNGKLQMKGSDSKWYDLDVTGSGITASQVV